MTLVNERTGKTLATRVELATSRSERRRGLLGRNTFDAGSALALIPCAAIHTAFMRFPIDVVFVDRDGRALRVEQHLKPWRIAVAARARAVIELPAGQLDGADVRPGDKLVMGSGVIS